MEEFPKIFICSHENCGTTFYRKDRFDAHTRIHTGERPFMCSYDGCFKSYTRAQHLKRHEAIHVQDNFRCSEAGCNAVLKTLSTLRKHINCVHNNKKKMYKCSYCSKEYHKHYLLKAHKYQHTNVKPYICTKENCGKSFLYPSRLKRHMKVHNGYICHREGCNKNLPTWSLYLKHFKVTHLTVHKCDFCEKTFTTSWNLKQHMSIHELKRETFMCSYPDCYRFYHNKRNLKYHERKYHVLRPFKCTYDNCPYSFKEKVLLEKHEKKHNPDIPLSSKKRRKKSKQKKKSLAAFLSGYTEPENHEKEEVFTSESNPNSGKDYETNKKTLIGECSTVKAENFSEQKDGEESLNYSNFSMLHDVQFHTSEENYPICKDEIEIIAEFHKNEPSDSETEVFNSSNAKRKEQYLNLTKNLKETLNTGKSFCHCKSEKCLYADENENTVKCKSNVESPVPIVLKVT